MKIFRLTILAVILLALLFVSSAMGGTENEFLSSGSQNEICLSFRNSRTMTGCCNASDQYQIINTTLTSRNQGIIHSYDGQRILCYDSTKKRFKIVRRRKLKSLRVSQCNRKRHKGRKLPKWKKTCNFTEKDQEILQEEKNQFRCILHHEQSHSGFTYIFYENSGGDKVKLVVRKKKVRKPGKSGITDEHERFIRLTESKLRGIDYSQCS